MNQSNLQKYNDLLRSFKSARSPYESDWFLNLSFYQGDQWIRWNSASKSLERPISLRNRVTLVDNRILPSVDSRVARKTKQRPSFSATPFSADEADRNASEIAEQVLDDRWIENNLAFKFNEVAKMADILGAGFWKIFWDGTIGDNVEYFFRNGEPVLNNGSPVRVDEVPDEIRQSLEQDEAVSLQSIAKGDSRVEVVSPFGFYPHPLATSLDNCEAIIEENIHTKEYLVKRFGEDVISGLSPDANSPIGIVESRHLSGLNVSSGSSDKTGYTVYELWERPSSINSNKGSRAIWSKDKVLLEDSLEDSPFEGCPYVMFSSVRVPGRFWPTSITSQLRGPQTELNKLISQAQENLQRVGNPALLSSRHANIEYSGLPGEHLQYDAITPDSKPDYLRPPDMPSYLQAQLQKIEDSITEISGVHEVSKANIPAGVTAASAINLLQEADDTRLGPEIQLNELALSETGNKLLKLMARFVDDSRIIRIAGEEGDWDIVEYKGNILDKCVNVECQAGSTIPRSKAAKQAAMQEIFNMMLQYGYEFDERSLRKFFRDFEIGGLEGLISNVSNSELQVSREHMMLKQGIAVNINEFDDNDYHIEGHEDFQRSRKWAKLDPQVQGIFAAHVAAHKEIRRNAINAQVTARKNNPQMEVQTNGNEAQIQQ